MVTNAPKYIIEIPVRSQELWITWGKLTSILGSAGHDPEAVLRQLLEIAASGSGFAASHEVQKPELLCGICGNPEQATESMAAHKVEFDHRFEPC